MLDEETLYLELRAACKGVFERHGVDLKNVNFSLLLAPLQVRNAVIKQEYADSKGAGKCDSAKQTIATAYKISVDYLNQILYSQ